MTAKASSSTLRGKAGGTGHGHSGTTTRRSWRGCAKVKVGRGRQWMCVVWVCRLLGRGCRWWER